MRVRRRSVGWGRRRAKRSLEMLVAEMDWRVVSGDLRDLVRVLRIGFRSGGSAGGSVEWDSVAAGLVRSEGCVRRMSVMIWREIVWSAGWPLAKQWRKRVRFSSARFLPRRQQRPRQRRPRSRMGASWERTAGTTKLLSMVTRWTLSSVESD